MTTLEELTQKIHKHCPELLELSFGCVVKNRDSEDIRRIIRHVEYQGGYPMLCCEFGMFRQATVRYFPIDSVEVLGHPITLEHVLKAMNARYDGFQWGVTIDGRIILNLNDDGDSVFIATDHRWSLSKPLSEQSPELVEWLNQIIV